jgi:hypothetical protein
MSALQRVKGASEQIKSAVAESSDNVTQSVDKSLGGNMFEGNQAPAYHKGLNHFVSKSAEMFGKKNLAEVLGVGDIPKEGMVPSHVHPSINLGCKKSYTHIDADIKRELLSFKKAIHSAELQRQIMAHSKMMPAVITDMANWKHVVMPKAKAFSLTDFSSWVPTLNTGFYFEEFELAPAIDTYFPEFQMMSRISNVPGATARLKGRLEADTATYSAQYNTQSNYSITAQDCVVHTDITEDLMQDMVPNAGGFERLRREVALGIQRSKEDAIINGDDTITSSVQGDGHMDSDVAGGAATLFNKGFKGLRKRALAASFVYDNAGAGVSLSTYNGLVPVLGKFAKDKGDLLLIVGPTIANKFVFGSVPEMLTAQNAGLNTATILTGVLPKVAGIEQYESEWVREDVNASGVYASSQVLTSIICVKKSRFIIGSRAPMKIWAMPSLPNSDRMLLSAKERFTFGGVPQLSGSEQSVAIAYNISLT